MPFSILPISILKVLFQFLPHERGFQPASKKSFHRGGIFPNRVFPNRYQLFLAEERKGTRFACRVDKQIRVPVITCSDMMHHGFYTAE
jgi:hypothetical protein